MKIFFNRSAHLFIFFILILSLVLVLQGDLLVARAQVNNPPLGSPDSPRESSGQGAEFSPDLQALAPGYCASSGGSTKYESISNISIVQSGPRAMTMTLAINIANPQNCTTGTACPSYDGSPEYVNVWIDYDGDKLWEANEKVVDQALTGYQSINYHGTMTATTLLQVPANAVSSTWIRANLGWGSDPNDPCASSWNWGNVSDQAIALSAPQITNITARGEGTPGNNPTTGKKLILEAGLNNTTGFTINKCTWSGDLPQGETTTSNCHYEYTPATGAGPDKNTYGEKNVTLTVSYTHSASGITGQVSKNSTYKVFFDKKGDDDGDSTPNWFEYWGDDAAVPQFAQTDVIYNSALSASTYGRYRSDTNQVEIGGAAPNTHYPSGIAVPAITGCPGGNFGGAKGIDSATEVVEHELRHKWVKHNWDSGAAWNGQTDSDQGTPSASNDDDLPDTFETSTNHTLNNNTDSCDLKTYKDAQYQYYGDNEFYVMTYSNGKTGAAANDWANEGKQSNPVFDEPKVVAEPGPVVASDIVSVSPALDLPVADLAGFATLSGSYTSAGYDSDSDTLFNSLNLAVGVNVYVPGPYTLVGWLQNSSGINIAYALVSQSLSAGSQVITLPFSGTVIRKSGLNGPYRIVRVELLRGDEAELVDADVNPHTSAAYTTSQFDPNEADLNGSYTITPVLVDADSYYDLLRFGVGVTVNTAGSYTLIGELSGPSPKQVVTATKVLSTGTTIVNLDFDGKMIFQSRTNGPYSLTNLRLLKSTGDIQNFVQTATTTSAYAYTGFAHSPITITAGSFVDSGLNLDADSEYEYLKEVFQIVSNTAGNFRLQANLKDSQGKLIYAAKKNITLASGTNSLSLEIPGGSVRSHGVNGPYRLEEVSLLTPQGSIVDLIPLADQTNAYLFTSFGSPLLTYSGVTAQQAIDNNGNGRYEVIRFTIPITAGETGYVTVQGSFMDHNGSLIGMSEMGALMTKGQSMNFTLSLSGYNIKKTQANGPFTLRDVYIYHAADTDQYVIDTNQYTTPAYTYQQFEGFPTYLPTLRR